ncbi:hypothetical protein ARL68_14660 [Listeria monocytogenes]|nr:hypothetical protein [Listeria monocytogenes]
MPFFFAFKNPYESSQLMSTQPYSRKNLLSITFFSKLFPSKFQKQTKTILSLKAMDNLFF